MAKATHTNQATYFSDIWLFDPKELRWQLVEQSPIGPGKRYGFGSAADEAGVYVFGGYAGNSDLADLWYFEFTTRQWRQLATDGPPARYCPALGLLDGKPLLFGGRSKTNSKLNYSDTWIFEGTWKALNDTGPGYHAKAASASADNKLWLFGGEGPQGHVSDLWHYDRCGWTRLQPCRDDDPVVW